MKQEELIIEKRSVDKTSSSSSTSEEVVQSKTEISIPLKKEDIVVEKKPYVKEEIVIKRKPVSETKTRSEQLITEKVSVRNSAGDEAVQEEKEDSAGDEAVQEEKEDSAGDEAVQEEKEAEKKDQEM